MDNPNFQDSFIKALKILRDTLTPRGIQMPSLQAISLDTIKESDALAVSMDMPAGSVAVVQATLYVPLISHAIEALDE